jgi:DNA ligase (NAD+)
MDGVSEATARLLYDKGIVKSAKDLYSIKDTDLIGIPGLGDSKIKNILFQIELSKKMSIIEFIDRLGIPSIGEKAAKKLGLTSIKKFLDFSDDKSSVIGACVVAFKSDNINYIKELISVLEITEVVEGASGKEKVCMTGKGPKSRNDLIADIEAMGYEFIDSITKETNILICEDTNGASSKLAKAKKMGIILKSYEDFFKK